MPAVKNYIRIFLLLFAALQLKFAHAQILNPVKWTTTVEQTKAGMATLVITAHIDEGWHMYSQNLGNVDFGPLPTAFKFTSSNYFDTEGKTSEEKPEEEYDPNFDMKLKYFSHSPVFRQKINVKCKNDFTLKGTVEFMVCDDKQCLPPDEAELVFNIKGNPAGNDCGDSKSQIKEDKQDKNNGSTTAAVPPASDTASKQSSAEVPSAKKSLGDMVASLEPGCGDGSRSEKYGSLFGIFFAGMLGGILALITPCVFPMIPLTVSFFTKRSTTRRKGISNALAYAISIMVIYVLLGLIITIFLGPDALNEMASNVYFNLLFFIIFLLFAFSFFGAFEITLPSSWINKADSASERGGFTGIFFMAFTLSLVSFSCTGPIIGTLLVEAARGSYMGPLAGMAGFAFALALPFALFAAFPAWLHSLPKSGGWLNSVKVVLGFLELALALKFLSNVDLAYHWGILQREIFIALWIIIFGLMGLYLLGKIKFSHDSDVKHVSIPRLVLAILTLSFTLYLIPGLWGAPLKLISGILPPDFYKEWKKDLAHDCPHDLSCFHDYEEGMAYARKEGKPVMIDFTGWSCVNCRRMEDNVWSEPKVLKRLSQDYVLISLYVDDKTPLPESEHRISEHTKRKIKSVGNKWTDLQAERYGTISQPYYVLIDNKANLLAEPRGYTPDVSTYLGFLDEGLCRYEKRKTSQVAAN